MRGSGLGFWTHLGDGRMDEGIGRSFVCAMAKRTPVLEVISSAYHAQYLVRA